MNERLQQKVPELYGKVESTLRDILSEFHIRTKHNREEAKSLLSDTQETMSQLRGERDLLRADFPRMVSKIDKDFPMSALNIQPDTNMKKSGEGNMGESGQPLQEESKLQGEQSKDGAKRKKPVGEGNLGREKRVKPPVGNEQATN
jgi:hypothetical protein